MYYLVSIKFEKQIQNVCANPLKFLASNIMNWILCKICCFIYLYPWNNNLKFSRKNQLVHKSKNCSIIEIFFTSKTCMSCIRLKHISKTLKSFTNIYFKKLPSFFYVKFLNLKIDRKKYELWSVLFSNVIMHCFLPIPIDTYLLMMSVMTSIRRSIFAH